MNSEKPIEVMLKKDIKKKAKVPSAEEKCYPNVSWDGRQVHIYKNLHSIEIMCQLRIP